MEHKDKIKWMEEWCSKNGLTLTLKGEVGIGRDCVGALFNYTDKELDFLNEKYNDKDLNVVSLYPDYYVFDEDYNRIDNNGDVFIPTNAYHKHTCIAVLGLGESAESQLYEWLKWFDDNNFKLEVKILPKDGMDELDWMFGKHVQAYMVKS